MALRVLKTSFYEFLNFIDCRIFFLKEDKEMTNLKWEKNNNKGKGIFTLNLTCLKF